MRSWALGRGRQTDMNIGRCQWKDNDWAKRLFSSQHSCPSPCPLDDVQFFSLTRGTPGTRAR